MTFDHMKSRRNIIFRIILLFIVFINVGTVAFSSINNSKSCTEFSIEEISSESDLMSDSNLINDDETDQSGLFYLTLIPEYKILIQQESFIFHNFPNSVWRPPKVF
jgi:hypothetical protein